MNPLPPRAVDDVVGARTDLVYGHSQQFFDGFKGRAIVKHHGGAQNRRIDCNQQHHHSGSIGHISRKLQQQKEKRWQVAPLVDHQ